MTGLRLDKRWTEVLLLGCGDYRPNSQHRCPVHLEEGNTFPSLHYTSIASHTLIVAVPPLKPAAERECLRVSCLSSSSTTENIQSLVSIGYRRSVVTSIQTSLDHMLLWRCMIWQGTCCTLQENCTLQGINTPPQWRFFIGEYSHYNTQQGVRTGCFFLYIGCFLFALCCA